MLPRILEPEVMDTPEEARAYDAMDHREVNRIFVEDFLAAFEPQAADGEDADADGDEPPAASSALPALNSPLTDVLDLGTGTAQIPVELCRRGERWRVTAVDLSASMLDVARMRIEAAGLRQRIRLDLIDAKGLPYEVGQFAAVISNSIVHHIPEPRAALAEAWRVVAPGGLAFFRDLLRPADDTAVAHLVETYAAGATDHQRKLFDDSLRAALTLDEVQALVAELGVDPATVTQTSDRHWTWSAWKSQTISGV
jgi:SAM-dependent methyltransferase